MDFGKIFGDLFTRQVQNPGIATFGGAAITPAGGPLSQGFNRVFNDPFANQPIFEEVKARQAGRATPGTLANPNAAGAGWLSSMGNKLGIVLPEKKAEKNYESCLTYMKGYYGKNVVMTGATGGIGSKVAKRLLKAGRYCEC